MLFNDVSTLFIHLCFLYLAREEPIVTPGVLSRIKLSNKEITKTAVTEIMDEMVKEHQPYKHHLTHRRFMWCLVYECDLCRRRTVGRLK